MGSEKKILENMRWKTDHLQQSGERRILSTCSSHSHEEVTPFYPEEH